MAAGAEDGRLARSARTRAAVIDALLALYEQGDLSPTAARVAEQAGVALRTVYGHFADMESLYAEAGQRELARTLERVPPVDPTLPFPARLAAFAAGRAEVLEWLLPVMRASVAKEPTSPQLQRIREQFLALADAQVEEVFAAEVARRDADAVRRVHDLVHLVAGGPAWVSLRVDRGLSPRQATLVLGEALERLVAPLLTAP
jgi:TetR/AcrR family transcriptional regulator of autoinduction and epiphytic fitness